MDYAGIGHGRSFASTAEGSRAVTHALEPIVTAELAVILSRLVDTYNVLPFMTNIHSAKEMIFSPLPDEMLALVVESEDYKPVIAGADPTWLAISGQTGMQRSFSTGPFAMSNFM